ncbi:enoyl-CoA hydratase-related protein [Nocardioides sp. R-C-SC26]|uniref:enoyl-CoA hydratase-related protein n=1 Tax=Nocardioides sp. R-C-SC26 TaxID=2870414 RepID=UPI001E628F97|nr:enoyl-CoA hydratase-related protein [Nocardioides sp. R-C-SC26]
MFPTDVAAGPVLRADDLDPRTPVLIGVGQSSERPEDDGYAALSPVELAAAASREALADAGATGGAGAGAAAPRGIAATRQFENSVPVTQAPFGRSTNLPRSVATRIGADPARAVLAPTGGTSPQQLITEFAGEIAAGRARAVLITGAEAGSTVRHLQRAGQSRDWSEDPGGQLEDRGYGLRGLISQRAVQHGMTGTIVQYAVLENARRARRGLSKAEGLAEMGALFDRFSAVAAENPHAVVREHLDAATLTTVDDRNRLVATPYPRFMIARDMVNQGAAAVLTSIEEARRLGVPEDRWVFLHGHAAIAEADMFARPDLDAPGAQIAVRAALEMAGVGVDDVDWFDFYSCYPIAVLNVIDQLGIALDDPRGLTVTGGLPFFGGPGNNYSLHPVVEIVHRARRERDGVGLVGANGGSLSKYAVGVYSARPAVWSAGDSARLQAEYDQRPLARLTDHPEGWASIDTYTVQHAATGRTAIVVARLDDGRRFVANAVPGDDALLDQLDGPEESVGVRVFARHVGPTNVVALDAATVEAFAPRPPGAWRSDYEHADVRREGHVVEIALRADALGGPAHRELSEVFDAFEADRDAWVAVLSGPAGGSFCRGEDPAQAFSGAPPATGVGGLSRRRLTKPVIAAIEGDAVGTGLEIALAATLIVVADDARLALDHITRARYAEHGGVARLAHRLPAALVADLAITGRAITGEDAVRYGLASRLAPSGSARKVARELAAEIATHSPTAVRVNLEVLADARSMSEVDAVAYVSASYDDITFTDDGWEAGLAPGEGRDPVWRNR